MALFLLLKEPTPGTKNLRLPSIPILKVLSFPILFQLKQAMDKEGLGYNAINSDSIQREEAEDMIRSYAASNSVEDLVFSSELAFEERKEIAMLARKYGLAVRKVMENRGGWKRTFLVLNKKVGAEFIIEQLEREGSWGKYELVKPPR